MKTSTTFVLISMLSGGALAQDAFETWTGYDIGFWPEAAYAVTGAAADMNGDGRGDVITGMGPIIGDVTVTLQDGKGGFLLPLIRTSPMPVTAVDALDVDQDGDMDVVAAGEQGDLMLFRNDGTGALAAAQTFDSGSGELQGIALGDLNGDGRTDVATVHPHHQNGRVIVFLHDGSPAGGFVVAAQIPLPSDGFNRPWHVAAGDLDGDGRIDLVVAREGSKVSVALNTASGFQPVQTYATGSLQWSSDFQPDVALGDADQDGDLDVFYGSTASGLSSTSDDTNGVMLLRNNGAGVLGSLQEISLPPYFSGPVDVAVHDYDGDGRADLFALNGHSGFAFWRNLGGSFQMPAERRWSGEYSTALLFTDVTGSGAADVLVTNRHSLEVTVHAVIDGQVQPMHPGFVAEPLSGGLASGDIDGDGDLDLCTAYAYAGGGGTVVLKNQGGGTFAAPQKYPGKGAMDAKFRDLDGDGDLDLLWADDPTSPPYHFRWRLNDGTGAFGAEKFHPVFTCGNGAVEAFDMDHDGDLDVFLSDYLGCGGGATSSVVYVSENLGSATFAPPYPLDFFLDPELIAHGDLNRDGHEDLVVTLADLVGVRFGNGDGTFQAAFYASTLWGPKGLVVEDVSGDGIPDVVTASMGADIQQSMTVLIGRDDGTLKPPVHYPVSFSADFGGIGGVAAGDVDVDGILDVVVLNYGSNDASYFRGLGGGKFAPHVRYGVGPGPNGLELADFDGDGALDLAALVGIPPSYLSREVVVVPGAGESPGVWTELGGSVPGSFGTPHLSGNGPLTAGATAALNLDQALPNGVAILVIGAAQANAPFFAGTLVPSPTIVLPGIPVGAQGQVTIGGAVPGGVPSGALVWFQMIVPDPGATFGVSLSNGLQAQFP